MQHIFASVNLTEKGQKLVVSNIPSMLAGYLEVAKVKEVYFPEEMRKNGKGQCLAIGELADKTPFGWVLTEGKEGVRFFLNAKLVRYEDMG